MAIRTNKESSGTTHRVGSVGEAEIGANAVVADHCNPFNGPSQWATFEYDFAELGGAVGALTLTDADPENPNAALTIPANSQILRVFTRLITPMTSAGAATMKLGITGNDDAFLAATAFDHASWDVAGDIAARAAEVPLLVGGSAVSVLATIAGADLTAGKLHVLVEYRRTTMA